ncbi:unnamed protein product, partial [Candidula unifasciata]
KSGQPVGQPQGQIGDRIIFSQEEEFSVSIEFSPDGKPVREANTKHLKRSSDIRQRDKRYLKCPAGLRVSHLKKFIRLKFTLPQHIQIDLFYESEPLFDTYSLMDVAYIYLWKRDCVLQLFYSFFEVPTKKRKLQSVTHISETMSKSSRVLDKPEKNCGDRKSSNRKEKSDTKKQSRMSGKKKSTSKANTSSPSNGSQQEALVAKGAVSSNLKRKHSDTSSTKDSSCLSRSGTTTLDTSSCSKNARCVDTIVPVKQCASVHTACRPGSKQTPSSSDCSPSSHLCSESSNCSIISHLSSESSACSVTSHFCTENTQCSIVSHPCVAHRNRNSKSPADSEVSITLLIKSSDGRDFKRSNSQLSPGCGQTNRLQKGDNTSEITYNTFLSGNPISDIKDNSVLAGSKFLEVKNTILKNCKNESKVTQRNIQNSKVVSEVQVSVNGKIAPELKTKQLVNGQFIFRLKNGKFTNGEVLSKASDGKSRFSESTVMDTRCQSGNKNIEVTCIKSGPNSPYEKDDVRSTGCTKFDKIDKQVHLGQGVSLVKKMKIHTKDSLDVKCSSVDNGKRGLADTGGKLDVDRISDVEDNKFHNGDSVFDMKDNELVSCEKVSNVRDKKAENNNEVCENSCVHSEVTSEFKDKQLGNVIAELKDANSSVDDISFLRKNEAFVHRQTVPTAHSFEQANSDTNNCSIKLEGTALSSSSQRHVLDNEDKKLITESGKRDFNLTYDGPTPVTEGRSSQSHSTANGSGKPSEILSASQLLQSETCVDKEQVGSISGAADCPTTTDSENIKDLCYDNNKNNVVGFKDSQSSRSDSPSAYVHKLPNPRLQKPKELETEPSGPSAKDVDSDTKENEIFPGSQTPSSSSKVNSIIGNAETSDADAAKTKSLSKQLPSEGSSISSDCTILILPTVCTIKPNCVNKIRQSISETLSALKPVSTKHETWTDSPSSTSAKEDPSENLSRGCIKQHFAPNKVKNIKGECRKQRYSPEVFKELLPSDHEIERQSDILKSVNLISKNVATITSKTDILPARQTSFVSTTASSEKPQNTGDVTNLVSSSKPVPLKLVQSAAENIVYGTSSPVTSSLASTACILPTSTNCLMSTSVTRTYPLTSSSASLLTKLTTTVKTNSNGTKPLAVKTSSLQSCTSATAAATKAVDTVSRHSLLAISSSTTQNKCLSSYTIGKGGTYWSNRQPVSADVSKTQGAPPQIIKSVFTPTSGSSEVAQPRVSGSNNIPFTSTSAFSNTALPACAVSSFLNLPPAETSPVKRPQQRKHPDSTNISSTNITLPSEAVKVDNFLFDIKCSEIESSDSYSQNRVSSSSGKEAQKSQIRTNLNSQTQLDGVTTDKSSKTTESHTTAVHHLPKTVSQTTRPYSTARSVSTSPSSKTKYSNNIIQTTKISTLIPKSSSVSSKAGAFPKTPLYPAHINSLLLSRRILNNSLASHYQRIDALSSISAGSSSAQELTPNRSALSSPSSSTPSSLVSSTTSISQHKMSSAARQSSKGISGRSDKNPKHKTIPPLCIPKSSLIGPTTLKLQRSPGSNDHYIFTPLLHYSPTSQHKMERSKSKESKHKTSHSRKSVHTGGKGTVNSPSKQRVPSIKISDINRNPVIVEKGGSSSSSNSDTNPHYHSPYKSYNHEISASSALESRTPRAHSRGRNEGNSTGHHDKMPVRDILRPSDSELLLSRHWHAYSTAELLFSGFNMPAHSKLHDLQYDTDAMPLDYSQSSSKS